MKFLKYLAWLVGFSAALPTFGFVSFGRTISIGLVSSALFFGILLIICVKMKVGLKRTARLYGGQVFLPLLYTLILTITNYAHTSISNKTLFPLSFFLCYVLFLALLYYSLLDPRGPKYALYGFLAGTVFLAVCFFLNIGVEINNTGIGGLDERFSVFGVNCNGLGVYCSLGFLVLVNDFILRRRIRIIKLIVLVFVAFLLASMVFATASRSAFLALVLGMVLIVLFYPTKNYWSKLITLLVGAIVLLVIAQVLYNSDLYVVSRLFEAVKTGDSSNRLEIINAYYPHIWEHPFFGVGDTGLVEVSKSAFGYAIVDDFGNASAVSPHNVLLECALTTGLIGLIIMMVFWFYCAKRAYNQFIFAKYSTPIIVLSCILISIFFGHILTDKYGWIVYAYMIAFYAQEACPQE